MRALCANATWFARKHAHIHAHTFARAHSIAYSRHLRTLSASSSLTHTCTPTHTHTHIHIHTHTHTHTHTPNTHASNTETHAPTFQGAKRPLSQLSQNSAAASTPSASAKGVQHTHTHTHTHAHTHTGEQHGDTFGAYPRRQAASVPALTEQRSREHTLRLRKGRQHTHTHTHTHTRTHTHSLTHVHTHTHIYKQASNTETHAPTTQGAKRPLSQLSQNSAAASTPSASAKGVKRARKTGGGGVLEDAENAAVSHATPVQKKLAGKVAGGAGDAQQTQSGLRRGLRSRTPLGVVGSHNTTASQ